MAPPKTVLIIDDDADIAAATGTLLERHGYHVLTACDGNLGLAIAERESPALVIVDMMMPKKNGFLVLETLKSRRENCPPIIMITANSGGRHRAYAESLGVDDYIPKPFEIARLLTSVRRLCPLEDGVTSQPAEADAVVSAIPK